MGTFLEKATATYVPVTLPGHDAAVEKILFDAQNFSTRSGGVLLMVNEPSKEDRRMLLDRQAVLARSMSHDREAIYTIIGQMLLGFSAAIKPNETAEQVAMFFVHELGLDPAVPTWAVSQACYAIRAGQVPEINGRTYPRPSTIAVRRVADSYAWKARAEIAVISDVLKGRRAAPEVTEAQRKKIGARFQVLATHLGGVAKDRIGSDEAGSRIKVLDGFALAGRRFIERQYAGQVPHAAPGIPISRELAARIAAPRDTRGWNQADEE